MRPMWFSSSPIKGLAATIFYFFPTLWRLSWFLAHHNVQLVCLEYPLPNVFYFPILRLVQRFRIVVGLHGDDVLSLHLWGHSDQWVVKVHRSSDWVCTFREPAFSGGNNCAEAWPQSVLSSFGG